MNTYKPPEKQTSDTKITVALRLNRKSYIEYKPFVLTTYNQSTISLSKLLLEPHMK